VKQGKEKRRENGKVPIEVGWPAGGIGEGRLNQDDLKKKRLGKNGGSPRRRGGGAGIWERGGSGQNNNCGSRGGAEAIAGREGVIRKKRKRRET